MTACEQVVELLDRYDGDFECNVGTACAWGGTLRLTITDPPGVPSESVTFHSVGQLDPEGVAEAVLAAAQLRLDGGLEPLPPPDWKR
jgi:hypothetical protein